MKDMMPDLEHQKFSTACSATMEDASQTVQAVVSELRSWPSVDVADEVEIVLAEALTNVVEHAYRDGTAGWIRLRCRACDDRLVLSILDGGGGALVKGLPGADMPELEVDTSNLPEGGFGWPLIQSLASSVGYRRRLGVNRLEIAFQLGAVPA